MLKAVDKDLPSSSCGGSTSSSDYEVPAAKREAKVGKLFASICCAKTGSGKQCGQKRRPGLQYCAVHQRQYDSEKSKLDRLGALKDVTDQHPKNNSVAFVLLFQIFGPPRLSTIPTFLAQTFLGGGQYEERTETLGFSSSVPKRGRPSVARGLAAIQRGN